MADLTDGQWEYIRLLVKWEQEQRQRPDGRGGRWSDARRVLNGVLWILRTGAPWQDLPPRYGPSSTCHRRFQQGVQSGGGGAFYGRSAKTCWPEENSGWKRAWSTPRSSGQKGGDRIGPTRCGKGSKIMAIADCHGLPVAVGVTSASPNESTLVEDTLRQRHVSALPERMIGDRAYDSDRLDERLRREHGIAMIAPNRRRRKRT